MKRLLIAFIALIMISFVPAQAKKEKKYLALGDSITYGETLDNPSSDSYPAKFAKFNNLSLTNEATSGDTSLDLLNKIDDYKLEEYDVITLCIGANDLLQIIKEKFIEIGNDPIGLYNFIAGIEHNLELQEKIDLALSQFEINFKQIISKLKAKNNNVYILNVYNPFKMLLVANFNQISAFYISKLNEIISNNAEGYKVIDIYSTFNKNSGNIINLGLLSYDPHPTKEGQALIYKTLNNEYSKLNIVIPAAISLAVVDLILLSMEIFIFNKIIFKGKKHKNHISKDESKPKIDVKEEKSSRFSRN